MVRVIITLIIFLGLQESFGQNCLTGQHWVKAYHRRAYHRTDGTYVSEANVTAHCQKNPRGYDFWKSLLLNGKPNGWPHDEEKTKAWTQEEVEKMLEALGDLPEELRIAFLRGIYRMDKSVVIGNPSSAAPGVISVYDEAFSSKRNLAEVLAHELGHQVYYSLTKKERLDYGSVTNWTEVEKKDGSTVRASRECCYVRDNNKISPEEDFAGNVQYYLFHSNKLKEITPHAFRWITERFGDSFKMRGQK
jgi:hypothetical protein